MEGWFAAIREACSAAVWSRGVELVRAGAVSGEHADDEEAVLRVATRGGLIAPTVTLHLEDEEWECTCPGRDDPCEHVAAAAIALRRARKQGESLPAPARSAGRVRYRIETGSEGQLELFREIVHGDEVHPLTTTLDAIASGRVAGPGFAATPGDLAVESVLGSRLGGSIPRALWPRLVDALSECDEVLLAGERVEPSRERVRPLAVVEDAPGGFRLRVIKDPSITRPFPGGVVLCGRRLRVAGESGLTGRELSELPEGRFYSFDRAAELSSEVIPSLEARVPVDVRTDKLPRLTRGVPPRIVVRVGREGGALSVLPLLVYGDPPRARVDADRLVHIQGDLPIRDPAAERRLATRTQRELGLAPGRRSLLEGEAAIEMAERLEAWPSGVEGDAHRGFFRAPPLAPRLDVAGGGFTLDFESKAPADADGRGSTPGRASAESVLRAWQDGDAWVPLLGGGLAPLPADWLARFGDRVADLLAARRDDGELPACVLPDLGALCEDLDQPRPPALSKLAPLLGDASGVPEAPLPDDLTATLRDYQRRGVDWLRFLGDAELGALLADDMGLGKTLQALCAIRGRTLVVAPTSVLTNWVEEAARFRPSLRVCLYHGPGRALDPEADLTLTSYALLRLDAESLGAVAWDTAILDEAQAIKNPESQSARAARGLRARARIALTGTPVENRLEELWSQLHFLNPGLLGGRRDFVERYARPIAGGDRETAAHLRRRLRPFLLRRLKRDVAKELPPRTDVVLHCVLDDDERRLYDGIHAATRRDVVARLAAGGSVLEALEALLRLRQASCHAALVPGQTAERSSKVELLLERLEQANEDGHRALVFSQWTGLLDLVEPHLRERQIDFVRLDGSTRDRGAVVGAFQSESGPPVMLVSLRAGGTGLNLTSADHIFLLDPWWNPAVEDQAADRAHRIGQTRPVMVHRLVAENTVEERILALQERKRELARAAVEESDPATRLSRDELIALLE
ncbi:MAG: SNF2-related protein [Myxococcota bacterium]